MNLTKISKINLIIYKITKLKTKIENFWELPQIGIWELGITSVKLRRQLGSDWAGSERDRARYYKNTSDLRRK